MKRETLLRWRQWPHDIATSLSEAELDAALKAIEGNVWANVRFRQAADSAHRDNDIKSTNPMEGNRWDGPAVCPLAASSAEKDRARAFMDKWVSGRMTSAASQPTPGPVRRGSQPLAVRTLDASQGVEAR